MTSQLPTLSTTTAMHLQQNSLVGHNTQWSVLKASGPTIREYLQGQITQDINKLSDQQAIYTCLLSPQGKAVSVLYIIAGHHGELILLTPSSHATATVARLRQFALGHQLRIGIIDSLTICSIHGIGATQKLDDLSLLVPPSHQPLSCQRQHDEDSFVVSMAHAYWVICNTAQKQNIQTNSVQISEDELESLRILQGTVQFGIEWNEQLHPLNANLIEYNGVDFEKGCYVGQEVTSRMHWRGGIKKKLYRVQVHGRPISIPCPILSTSNIGVLKSAAIDANGDCFGIALLPIAIVESGANLSLENQINITVLETCHA